MRSRRGTDPTRTATLRQAYSQDLTRRFRALKSAIRHGVVDRDALGLGGTLRTQAVQPQPPVPPMPSFVFETDERKIAGFMRWLEEAEDDAILEVVRREGRTVVARNAWQDVYVTGAYRRGIQHADQVVSQAGLDLGEGVTLTPIGPPTPALGAGGGAGVGAGSMLLSPMHADRIGIIFTRNFMQLQGITEAMNQQMSRVLAEGIAAGRNPRVVARELNRVVDSIGITRAKVLAQTEIIHAHAEATLNRYEEYGLEGVTVLAEILTANDGRVCERCQRLEERTNRRPIPISEARGLIPVHPRCRCSWIGVVPEDRMRGARSRQRRRALRERERQRRRNGGAA